MHSLFFPGRRPCSSEDGRRTDEFLTDVSFDSLKRHSNNFQIYRSAVREQNLKQVLNLYE